MNIMSKNTIRLMVMCVVCVFIAMSTDAFAAQKEQKAVQGSPNSESATMSSDSAKIFSERVVASSEQNAEVGYLPPADGYLISSPQFVVVEGVGEAVGAEAGGAITDDSSEGDASDVTDGTAGTPCSDGGDDDGDGDGGAGAGDGLKDLDGFHQEPVEPMSKPLNLDPKIL